uniref:Uncharacterized protein n=1 Tax=Arion vulgaris TaxID=1028688 RepID=A0A0B6Z6A8_9EUPU
MPIDGLFVEKSSVESPTLIWGSCIPVDPICLVGLVISDGGWMWWRLWLVTDARLCEESLGIATKFVKSTGRLEDERDDEDENNTCGS